jgi:terminal oxidase heme-binding subunit I
MILLSIVPAAMAVLYFMIPMMTGRQWFSSKMAWFHWLGYVIGSVLFVVGYELQGLEGLIRRAEIYPRIPSLVDAEVLSTVGALIAQVATLVWFLNLVLTLVKGRTARLEGLSVGQLINTVASSLGWEGESINISTLFSKIMIKKAISSMWALGILGSIIIVVSMFPLAMSGNTYNDLPWIWITLLTLGIVLIAYPILRGAKSL